MADNYKVIPISAVLIVSLAFFALAVFLLGTSPLSHPRIFMNQRRAVSSLRHLNRAQQVYAAGQPEVGFACNISDLGGEASGPSPTGGLVDRVLASGTKSAYRFEIRRPQRRGHNATAYTVTAVPVVPGTTGDYALCTDQSGEVWYSENGSPSDCLAMRKPVERKYR
jgi:type IV pilus assembly protein PilA